MKRILVALAIGLALVALPAVVLMAASESGEVVVVTTRDDAGTLHETRLWIVEQGGDLWLRAGDPGNAWLVRLSRHPEVEVMRGGAASRYRAEPVPSSRDAVNEALRAKYGWADATIDLFLGRDDAVPVRLAPVVDEAGDA